MGNDFTSFHPLSFFGVNNIWAKGVLNKNKLRKCAIIGDKQLQKKQNKKKKWNVDTLNSAHQAKKQYNFD